MRGVPWWRWVAFVLSFLAMLAVARADLPLWPTVGLIAIIAGVTHAVTTAIARRF